MTDQQTSELGKAIQEVSEKASLLVREEVALAKAELTEKAAGLAKGAAIGAAAGAVGGALIKKDGRCYRTDRNGYEYEVRC